MTTDKLEACEATLKEIGVARFLGRINTGMIETDIGYQALERYMEREKTRPLLSKLSQALLSRTDSYTESKA